ncbi:chromate efflux transporter [Acuticoccus sp. MNP-M23]|uniref:chromate efflux transporter n=1 Tax=Acuticoccus sp. MNP-M23 TaxID=3072793 RepID=UPI0028169506|nr:chromate efflux transporter [Acuticoccus sp. MNP-M23]WMS41128.1 chromate efflux transporter [Acuticoccus sp. MNP-M23]
MRGHMMDRQTSGMRTREGTAREVFFAFLPLGFTAFGGPVAHLGFFRTAFVARLGWLSDAAYADLVALCQFLPGPASSQVGMALGLRRAGLPGLLCAWLAFTLPSALALGAFGLFLSRSGLDLAGAGWIAGLKAAAVAVVANALLGMAGTLAATRARATIAALAAIAVLLTPWPAATQLAVILAGGVAGLLLGGVAAPADAEAVPPRTVSRPIGIGALVLFVLLLAALPVLQSFGGGADLFARVARAGALVFGGGHVVLPLLEGELHAMVGEGAFLAGYGAAQAVPGPLFTFAAYLGAVASPFGGAAGAAVALVAIFLPGALLVVGVMPFWEDLRRSALALRALAGVNAAVVGLLAAVFYDPVFLRGVPDQTSLVVAIAAFCALRFWAVAPWAVVLCAGAAGWAIL